MSLTNLHTSANYQDELHQFMKKMEGFNNGLPYFDAKGSTALVTIGIGANIDTVSNYLSFVLAELGIDGVVSEIDSTKTANQLIKAAMDSVPNGSANNLTLQSALDDVLQRNFPSLYGEFGTIKAFGTFSLTETQAYNVLDKIIADKQPKLDEWLTEYNIDVTSLKGTNEYMVLTSLFYNREIVAKTDSAGNIIRDAQGRRIPTSNSLIGPKLLAALEYDNRAEAWFEIRYNSNGGNSASQGIANRRYSEADDFGLRDSGTLTQDQEIAQAKEIMRMWTRHKDAITQYESSGKYPPPTDVGTGAQYVELSVLELEYEFAPNSIIDGEVIVGAGLDTYAYLEKTNINDTLNGTNQNDLIFGEKGNDTIMGNGGSDVIYGGEGKDQLLGVDGNDTIYGEAGDDIIVGGLGNDYVEGGIGNDIYIINTGDGTDTIEDKQGNNRVIVNGKEINLLIKQADGTYKNPDGKITATVEGANNDLVVRDAATGVQIAVLNQNFQNGDFGIRLVDAPVNPQTTNTIVGDLSPLNNPPQYDSLGNIITNPDSPAPNRNDILYDSAGNDRIEGKGGDDTINADKGGNDYLDGGSGNDLIQGGLGNDTLYGRGSIML